MDHVVPNCILLCHNRRMARPREFDTEEALERAMNVFWEFGYDKTTLPDLLDGMNITRGSLYKAFKSKKFLFLSVLKRYDEQEVNAAVRHLERADMGGWDRIVSLFDNIAETVDRGERRGCLLCSAVAGPASYDREISAAVQELLDRMRMAFQAALEASDLSVDSECLAQFLTTHYVGIRNLSRMEVPASAIEDSTRVLRCVAQALKPLGNGTRPRAS